MFLFNKSGILVKIIDQQEYMRKGIPVFFGLLIFFLGIWVFFTPNKFVRSLMERLEHTSYDLQLRAQALTGKNKPVGSVVIVDIDDKSLQAEGHWPWTRNKLADLVDALTRQGAAVIAFDMFFSEPDMNLATEVLTTLQKKQLLTPVLATTLKTYQPLFNTDEIFAKSLTKSTSILAIGFTSKKLAINQLPAPLFELTDEEAKQFNIQVADGFVTNIPVLQRAVKNGGFINIYHDEDGVIRRAPLVIAYQNKVYPSLALQAILSFLEEKAHLVIANYTTQRKIEGIAIGQRTISTDERAFVLIPFVGTSYTFPYYSATDVLHNHLPKDALLGKVIFVGTSAIGLGDIKAVAVQSSYPGVEVQATIANGLLANNFSLKPAWTLGAELTLVILFGLLSAFIFPYLGPRLLTTIIFVFPPIIFLLNNWFLNKTHIIIYLLLPMLLVLTIAIFNLIYGYIFESSRRKKLKEMFGQYVPEKFIDEMLKAKSDYGLRGEMREMSVLFADIRHFTTIAEGMNAEALVSMLNEFFTPMTEIIFKHQGTIDKYIGDLIMAFWNAPLKDIDHAKHAIDSALEMQKKVNAMRETSADEKFKQIHIGIGINSGEMNVGNMGSRYRRNYTVLGDAVNLGSRVESLTKFYGVGIIVTEFTRKNQLDFVFRRLDMVRVVGKKTSVALYEVIGTQAELTHELKQELALHHSALDYYLQQRWDDALKLFTELQQQFPATKIYEIYVERINTYSMVGVPENWDGVYEHATK